jgi:hypothetical protein
LVDLAGLHSLSVEMHGGMLTLATICILATVIAKIHFRNRRTSDKYGSFWPMDSLMGKISRYTEPTAYLAGIGGVIGLVASAVIGIYVWPLELITASTLGLNKVMFSVFATELWIIFVVLRSKYGESLWKNNGLATVYSCLALIGFLFSVLAGSYGAHMALKGSILDPIYDLFGIDILNFGVTGFNYTIILIAVSLVLIIVPIVAVLYIQRRRKIKDTAKS